LFQEFQFNKRKTEDGTLEERIAALEQELDFVESVLEQMLEKLTSQNFTTNTEVPSV
jgi:uncharacterized coiled-coil protein SlyX